VRYTFRNPLRMYVMALSAVSDVRQLVSDSVRAAERNAVPDRVPPTTESLYDSSVRDGE